MQFSPAMQVLPGSKWERVWTTSLWSAYFLHWPRQNFFLQYQYNIKQTGDENKKIYQLWDCCLIQHQILQSNIMRIVCQEIRRINNEIITMKGIKKKNLPLEFYSSKFNGNKRNCQLIKTLLPGLSVKPKYESNSLSLVVGSFLFFSFLFPLFLLIL